MFFIRCGFFENRDYGCFVYDYIFFFVLGFGVYKVVSNYFVVWMNEWMDDFWLKSEVVEENFRGFEGY